MSLKSVEDAARHDVAKIEAEIPTLTGWVKAHWIVVATVAVALAVVLYLLLK